VSKQQDSAMKSDKKDLKKIPESVDRRNYAIDMKAELNKKISVMNNKNLNGAYLQKKEGTEQEAHENANVDRARNNSEMTHYSSKK
jgi:hypothetical protein